MIPLPRPWLQSLCFCLLSSFINLVQQLPITKCRRTKRQQPRTDTAFNNLNLKVVQFTKYVIETLIFLIVDLVGTTKTILNIILTDSEYSQTGARTTKFRCGQVIVCPISNANNKISLQICRMNVPKGTSADSRCTKRHAL